MRAVGAHVARSTSGASDSGGQLARERDAVVGRARSPRSAGLGCAWPVRSRSSRLASAAPPARGDERHRDGRVVERAPEALLGARWRRAARARSRARR